jgi:hypothetical protein
MRRAECITLACVTAFVLSGCSHKAYNYLGPWYDENRIAHYVHEDGVIDLLVEPAPLPPRTNPDTVPITLARGDFEPVYNPAIVTDLLAIYHEAARFMPYLKTFREKGVPQTEAWEQIRSALELRATEDNVDMMIQVGSPTR